MLLVKHPSDPCLCFKACFPNFKGPSNQSFTDENSRIVMNRSPEICQESDRRVMKNEMLRCVRIVEECYK